MSNQELVNLSDKMDSHLVLKSILGVPQHLYIAVWCCFQIFQGSFVDAPLDLVLMFGFSYYFSSLNKNLTKVQALLVPILIVIGLFILVGLFILTGHKSVLSTLIIISVAWFFLLQAYDDALKLYDKDFIDY